MFGRDSRERESADAAGIASRRAACDMIEGLKDKYESSN